MRGSRLLASLSLGLIVLAGCATPPAGGDAPAAGNALTAAPPLTPNMARVWMLRQRNVENPIAAAGDPIVYVNGAPLGQVVQGTVFYHDLAPGSYHFTVQPYFTPANLKDKVQLGPGVTAFLQVQAVPNWEMGSTAGGGSYAVLTMAPQDAEAAIPDLKFIGQR